MKTPYVIIINGHPCTGKTYLIKHLSIELKIPYLSRDELKELLFNSLGGEMSIGPRSWEEQAMIYCFWPLKIF